MAIDETGNTYGQLSVLKRDGTKGKQSMWLCRCSCGNIKSISGGSLRRGATTSCGCTQRDNITKHGMYKTRTYSTYMHMLDRCYNEGFKQYHDYGGKGVKVCDDWLGDKGFIKFLEDMGERPHGMTLNRIQRSMIYSKDTCEWATLSEQNFDKVSGRANTSGRVGVWWNGSKNRWIAEISYQNRKITKRFKTFEDACEFRGFLEIKYFGFTKEGDKR